MSQPSIEILQRVPLFADLERRDLTQIASSFKAREYAAGDTLATEGEGGVGFFLIESGEATVTVRGREIARLKAGDSFGEVALIDDGARTATVTADTDMVCYGMSFWEFRPIVESSSQIAWKLLQALAKKLRAAEQR
ncbi:MAG: cyclic nucleotide-binding domain-containing protein [Actinobacteria bacterium]|nr:cyclic nucleotide-binding domain-containing protein [Actinomycetota bacterium]